MSRFSDIRNALLAALLFGASAPVAKMFLHALSPLELAGALYLGSGSGLWLWRSARIVFRKAPKTEAPLKSSEWQWLVGAILSGGLVAPLLLMGRAGHYPGFERCAIAEPGGVRKCF